MGACASAFKQMKAEEGIAAPLPEAPKEEILVQVTEVKPEQDEKKPEDVVKDDKKPSLESLLSMDDEVKETETDKEAAKTEEVPQAKEEEKKVEQVKEEN